MMVGWGSGRHAAALSSSGRKLEGLGAMLGGYTASGGARRVGGEGCVRDRHVGVAASSPKMRSRAFQASEKVSAPSDRRATAMWVMRLMAGRAQSRAAPAAVSHPKGAAQVTGIWARYACGWEQSRRRQLGGLEVLAAHAQLPYRAWRTDWSKSRNT